MGVEEVVEATPSSGNLAVEKGRDTGVRGEEKSIKFYFKHHPHPPGERLGCG